MRAGIGEGRECGGLEGVYVCMFYVCMYVCMYVWMDGWMYVCMYVCMYICDGKRVDVVNEVSVCVAASNSQGGGEQMPVCRWRHGWWWLVPAPRPD